MLPINRCRRFGEDIDDDRTSHTFADTLALSNAWRHHRSGYGACLGRQSFFQLLNWAYTREERVFPLSTLGRDSGAP